MRAAEKRKIMENGDNYTYSCLASQESSDSQQNLELHLQVDATPCIKIESCKRFISLSSKLVQHPREEAVKPAYKSDRVNFYKRLVGRCNRDTNIGIETNRQHSQEEELWQNELKDLVWLELQAWHANRTPIQHDKYLYESRKSVKTLLDEILQYSFTFENRDKGSEVDENTKMKNEKQVLVCFNRNGCLSMFCTTCMNHQNRALKEVEMLLDRLEWAESLYPSNKAFGVQYPLVISERFKTRIESLRVWYNMMKKCRHLALTIGKHLLRAQNVVPELLKIDVQPSSTNGLKRVKYSLYEVGTISSLKLYADLSNVIRVTDYLDTEPIINLGQYFTPIASSNNLLSGSPSPSFRIYCQTVLKTRGLRKTLQFLERMHAESLSTSHATFNKPGEFLDVQKTEAENCDNMKEIYLEILHKYGFWSEESKAINLPSYRSSLLFLSRLSLDVIHCFIILRLKTKTENPSILSIRQILSELKDGLRLAVIQRKRCLKNITPLLWDTNMDDALSNVFTQFDNSTLSCLKLYLEYLTQWIRLHQKEKVQKVTVDEEWAFVTSVCSHMPGGLAISAEYFCQIASELLKNVDEALRKGAENLLETFRKSNDSVVSRHAILNACRELQNLCDVVQEKCARVIVLGKTLCQDLGIFTEVDKKPSLLSPYCNDAMDQCIDQMRKQVMDLCDNILEVIVVVGNACTATSDDVDDVEHIALQLRIRDVLHQFYKFAFAYQKDLYRAVRNATVKGQLSRIMVEFSYSWMRFTMERCEPGRGIRPRWAIYGLDFLLICCEPDVTIRLTDEEFEDFKKNVKSCMEYVIGMKDTNGKDSSSSTTSTSNNHSKFRRSSSIVSACYTTQPNGEFSSRMDKVRYAIEQFDEKMESNMRSQQLIGQICISDRSEMRDDFRPRTVNFTWQRGMKIGQGRFGKVYTAVNNATGELMAMKVIKLYPFDHKAVKRLSEELQIVEGIIHNNLVQYYGIEECKERMLIFMELCDEGTLENLISAIENGLPEFLIRRYMKQLVHAVDTLHKNTIVHHDIKTANIFLTSKGNVLKLGDFGSAVKIKSHTTVPGELNSFVGTQAYMAPEIFTNLVTEGHGRAVDVWSIGCVLIEMASGRRPWSEFDSNYQIMFKVGMGQTPAIPDNLTEEGKHFVRQCLQHNPHNRSTTAMLLQHSFIQVDAEEYLSYLMPSILNDDHRFGTKT